MAMQKLRLADQNLNIKVRELLGDFGIGVGGFKVIDSFPSDRAQLDSYVLPTIVVTTNKLFGTDVELGANQWENLTFSLDVYAATDGQRDDLGYYFWKNLNEKVFTFYDFNDGYPGLATAISYAGLTQDGEYVVDGVNSTTIAPPAKEEGVHTWDGEKHHQLLFGVIRMGNS